MKEIRSLHSSGIVARVRGENWSLSEESAAVDVVETAGLLAVPLVAQRNEAVPEESISPEVWCAKVAKLRRDGNKVGIQAWHELKTVVLRLEFSGDSEGEIVFVHLRSNRRVQLGRVAQHYGAEAALFLTEHEMSKWGWGLGCVNPFTSVSHRHLFDRDLEKRYSHRGEVWTNIGNRRASIRFDPRVLIAAMEGRGLGSRAIVTSGPSKVLGRVDRMLRARLVLLLGNPPFLVQDYLDIWMQAQHRFLRQSREILLEEIGGGSRKDTRRLEPDGDQWFIPSYVVISHRGGPVNLIEEPIYRENIARHDQSVISLYREFFSEEKGVFPVLDVPDPSSAANFDDDYRSLVDGRMFYFSILESLEGALRYILGGQPIDAPVLVPDCIEAARKRFKASKYLRVFVLAGMTTLSLEGPVRTRLCKLFGKDMEFVFPDRHSSHLQEALEDLKRIRGNSSAGSRVKDTQRDVVFKRLVG